MNHKKDFSMNIGLPSILLIFVVLCLISFGVLSLVSANADWKLCNKVLDRQKGYYNACNLAEDQISIIDKQLHNVKNNTSTSADYFSSISDINTELIFPITDIQTLKINLSFIDPYEAENSGNDNKLYRIESWKIVTDDSLNYDSSLHLMEIEDVP